VPHEVIKLEITESLMMEDINHFREIFNQFHAAGFTIWIDDFGSGYSSLNVLQNYSFDLIKFDMLFLRNFNGVCGSFSSGCSVVYWPECVTGIVNQIIKHEKEAMTDAEWNGEREQ
jgi:EAL domain-containing protein (putative c-di-GMP-specific phosphodiesterase class I)